MKCKECKYFERMKWHKSIDENESDQLGGKCTILLRVLQITNAHLWNKEYLHVMETFGCSMWKEKKDL